jgi:hypothetical protein
MRIRARGERNPCYPCHREDRVLTFNGYERISGVKPCFTHSSASLDFWRPRKTNRRSRGWSVLWLETDQAVKA